MRVALAAAAAGLFVHGAAAQMIPAQTATLQGLDKISARVSQIEAPVGASVTFGTLSIMVRDCEKSRPEDPPDNAAFIQIYETPPGEDTKRLFSGWMFSSSPALSKLEHPVYDVILLGCKLASAPPSPPPPKAPPSPPANPRGKTPR
jgi:hypothetical protein